MKKLLILTTMLLTFSFANAQRMYDGSGRQIGRVDGDRFYDGLILKEFMMALVDKLAELMEIDSLTALEDKWGE